MEDISPIVVEKLRRSVTCSDELDMIIDLLDHEKRYNRESNLNSIKKEFSLLMDQYFPFSETENE